MVADREGNISAKELDTARFWVKLELEGQHLPILSEFVEEQLFMQGRTAWNYKYSDLKVEQIKVSKRIAFNVNVLLKKEFHDLIEQHRFSFNATCIYCPDPHKLTVTEIELVE